MTVFDRRACAGGRHSPAGGAEGGCGADGAAARAGLVHRAAAQGVRRQQPAGKCGQSAADPKDLHMSRATRMVDAHWCNVCQRVADCQHCSAMWTAWNPPSFRADHFGGLLGILQSAALKASLHLVSFAFEVFTVLRSCRPSRRASRACCSARPTCSRPGATTSCPWSTCCRCTLVRLSACAARCKPSCSLLQKGSAISTGTTPTCLQSACCECTCDSELLHRAAAQPAPQSCAKLARWMRTMFANHNRICTGCYKTLHL